MVDRCFPNASHQAVVLSTDTEVDRMCYRKLAPHIARSYRLAYEEEHPSTTITGYKLQVGAETTGKSRERDLLREFLGCVEKFNRVSGSTDLAWR